MEDGTVAEIRAATNAAPIHLTTQSYRDPDTLFRRGAEALARCGRM